MGAVGREEEREEGERGASKEVMKVGAGAVAVKAKA